MYRYKKQSFLLLFFIYHLSTSFLYAQGTPKNILLEKCLFSYTKTYKYFKKNKAFAYGRVAIGEKDYCAWTQGLHDIKSAQSIALKACNEDMEGVTCKIVDVNDAWTVEEGDFSIVIPADNTPLTSQKREAVIHEVKNIVLEACLNLFKIHLEDKGHKVFAYSIDEDGNFACATSKEHQTLRKAAIVAIKRCEDQKDFMGKEAPKHRCLSLFDGKNILAKAQDFNITLSKKENKFLSQEAYLKEIDKAKEILSGACLTQYKYYLRSKDHKAFYIAKEKAQNLVCGLSLNKFTIVSAKKDAFSKCKSEAKRKRVGGKCRLFRLNLNTLNLN